MLKRKSHPYCSIIFVNRNDNYGSDQKQRIELFIKYYEIVVKKYPGIFEFLICDWNPPENKQSLEEAFKWDNLQNVTHYSILKEIHQQLCPDNSRPILDYVGRNFLARRAKGEFIMIINQDILLSQSLIDFIGQEKLKKNYFYRCDRYDFKFEDFKFETLEEFKKQADENLIAKHIRSLNFKIPCSYFIGDEKFNELKTVAHKKEKYDAKENLINSKFFSLKRKLNRIKDFFVKYDIDVFFYKRYFLHTNASGDFIIMSKKAFFKVRGFPQSYKFYMHTDSYMCVQLLAAGYKQIIFDRPHTVYHNDHSRLDRESRPESMTYAQHAEIFAKILLGRESFKRNDKNWGLRNLYKTKSNDNRSRVK